MKIIAFAGSNSSKSINKKLATYASSLFENAEVEVLDLNEFEKNENKIQVDLTDNYENTVKEFNEKYGNSKPVVKQLIRIE